MSLSSIDPAMSQRSDAHKNIDGEARSPLILVVDDSREMRALYRRFLSSSGFRVAEAQHGAEGVECAKTLQPNLVLMDLSMPGMDGRAAIRLLKDGDETRHIKIAVISGHVPLDIEDEARDLACDRYILKPCGLDELHGMIRELLTADH